MSEAERRDDIPAISLDLLVVAAFAVAGRASHGETLALGEVFDTALPFWVALLTAHLGFRMGRRSTRPILPGVVLWVFTWGAGLALRLLLGDTAAWPFVAVAGGMLAVGLLGWRAGLSVAGRARRRSRRRAP